MSELGLEKMSLVLSKSSNYDPTYENAILRNNFRREAFFLLKNSVFGSKQKDIGIHIYESLCGFMFQICVEEGLQPCTFSLAMQLISAAMHKVVFHRSDFEMMCCACLLIASKLEDICPPSIATLSAAFGGRFGEDNLLRMEQRLLADCFKLDVFMPTRRAFSSTFIKAGKLSEKEKSLVEYLTDMSYLDFNLYYIKPSLVAAAAVHLTLQILRERSELLWEESLKTATGYSESDILEAVLRLRRLHWGRDETRSKYFADRYCNEETFFASEITAVSFANLRFDNLQLPKSESKIRLRNYYCEELVGDSAASLSPNTTTTSSSGSTTHSDSNTASTQPGFQANSLKRLCPFN